LGEVHTYRCRLEWSGSTAGGYEAYDRTHGASAPPARQGLQLSADPAFGGNPELLNPEQLLLLAASSCQALTFLAIAARARLDVVSYTDEAEAVMPEDEKPVRITRITLRPHIVVAGDADEERVRRHIESGHRHCFIANSLTSEIVIEPTIELRL
jgi:organic hydroperoxide reductase OsmC/OhrA